MRFTLHEYKSIRRLKIKPTQGLWVPCVRVRKFFTSLVYSTPSAFVKMGSSTYGEHVLLTTLKYLVTIFRPQFQNHHHNKKLYSTTGQVMKICWQTVTSVETHPGRSYGHSKLLRINLSFCALICFQMYCSVLQRQSHELSSILRSQTPHTLQKPMGEMLSFP